MHATRTREHSRKGMHKKYRGRQHQKGRGVGGGQRGGVRKQA